MHNKQLFSFLKEPIPITEQVWPKDTLPLVATGTLTYNHEPYIRECIEGILMQKTTFPVKIVIFEDCSTDNTDKILKEYGKKYPNLFRVFYMPENTFRKPIRRILKQPFMEELAKAEYIALCEGDDYWTDPLKLQKQVDFLEGNQKYVMSYGNALIEDLTNTYHKKKYYINSFESKSISKEKVFGLGVPTCTMVFRAGIQIPSEFSNVISGDQFLRLFLSKKGLFYYNGEIFGAHRKHPKGISRSTDKYDWHINTAENLKKFLSYADPSQKKHINKKIVSSLIYAFFSSRIKKDNRKSFSLLPKIFLNRHFYSRSSLGLFRDLAIEVFHKKNFNVIDIF